jgi:hypothetical protein
MKEDMPEEHSPTCVRLLGESSPGNLLGQNRIPCYAVGKSVGPDSYVVLDRPTNDLFPCLDRVPGVGYVSPGFAIIRFNEDGTQDILYRWRICKWVLMASPERIKQ